MPPFDHDPAPPPLPGALPAADPRGNYWLGSRVRGGAAILSSGFPEAGRPRWFATRPGEGGPLLTPSGSVRYFAGPEDALAALREAP